MTLYERFNASIAKELATKLWKSNPHLIPRLNKVIVSMGIGSLATRKWVKDFSDLEKNLAQITWQKPYLVKAKKSVSNFKLREGMPVMLSVTLRWPKAYDFIERLVTLVLPRVRDFQWISPKSFDKMANYSLWLKDQSVFPDIKLDEMNTLNWIQITLVPNTDNMIDSRELMKALGFVFYEK